MQNVSSLPLTVLLTATYPFQLLVEDPRWAPVNVKSSHSVSSFCDYLIVRNRHKTGIRQLVSFGTLKPGFHMAVKSQTIGDFTVSRPSQILPTNENSKSLISPIVWDSRGQFWRIGSVSIFPTHPRFLRWSAIIKHGVSGESGTDFAGLSDISAKSGRVGKK